MEEKWSRSRKKTKLREREAEKIERLTAITAIIRLYFG
jgi:hypothetical protein